MVSANELCVYVDIESNNICDNCGIIPNVSDNQFPGRFSLGSGVNTNPIAPGIVGDSQFCLDFDNSQNLIIDVYGPDSTTNLYLSAGQGFNTSEYVYNLPLNNIIVPSGQYQMVFRKILHPTGVIFSANSVNPPSNVLSCPDTVEVPSLTCNNGPHNIQFSNTTNSAPPPFFTTFDLDNTNNFLAFSFNGDTVPDRIRFEFSGSAYNNIIYLEDVDVGLALPTTDLSPTTIPRTYNGGTFTKYISLSALTINNGDFITIRIQPNQTNFNTSYSLNLWCVENITCNDCAAQYKNKAAKIRKNTITAYTINDVCTTYTRLSYRLSGCTNNNLNPNITGLNDITNGNGVDVNLTWASNLSFCGDNWDLFNGETCTTTGNRIITTIGTIPNKYISFNCQNFNDFTTIFNQIKNAVTQYSGSSNPNNINYIRYMIIRTQMSTVNDPNLTCTTSDNIDPYEITFHPALCQVITSTTVNGFEVRVQQTQTAQKTLMNFFDDCDFNCDSNINNFINIANAVDTYPTQPFTYTSNVGLKNDNVVFGVYQMYSGVTTPNTTYWNSYVYYINRRDLFTTFPYSGTNTLIRSLSAVTCSNVYNTDRPIWDISGRYQTYASYELELTNPSNPLDFRIYAYPIVNWVDTSPKVLAYGYSGGTEYFVNPLYIM
jgi:hypothetical protein